MLFDMGLAFALVAAQAREPPAQGGWRTLCLTVLISLRFSFLQRYTASKGWISLLGEAVALRNGSFRPCAKVWAYIRWISRYVG